MSFAKEVLRQKVLTLLPAQVKGETGSFTGVAVSGYLGEALVVLNAGASGNAQHNGVLTITTSDDVAFGSGVTTLLTFTAVANAASVQSKVFNIEGAKAYIRATWTVTGGFTGAVAVVAIARPILTN